MSNPIENLTDATSPGKQLGEIGEGAGKIADGGGKVLDQFANNTKNRVLVFILICGLIFALWGWYKSANNKDAVTTVQQDKIDDSKKEVVVLLKTQIEDLKAENKELKAANRDYEQNSRHQDTLISKSNQKIDRLINMYEIEKNKKR